MRTTIRLTIIGILVALLASMSMAGAGATGSTTWAQAISSDGQTQSVAGATWDQSTYALNLQVSTGTLASGECVTVYFDWASNQHHDARGLRDCLSNDTISYSFPDSNPSNITGGPWRLGVCYAKNDTLANCIQAIGKTTIRMNWTPWPNLTRSTPCDVSWVRRNADGTTSQFIDQHSQRNQLVGASC